MIEEPANVQAGGIADEDPASQSWYLAHDDRSKLLWIHTRGARTSSNGDPILHKGRELRSYPSLRCYVFARTACEYQEGDPVAQDWIRLDNLEGRSAFVGINYPFLLKSPLQILNLLLTIPRKLSESSHQTVSLLHTCAASIAHS